MTDNEQEVPTITCDGCGREWPETSEQAVVHHFTGECYGCLVEKVNAECISRREAANYHIDNCPHCTGRGEQARLECTTCNGRGWIVRGSAPVIELLS